VDNCQAWKIVGKDLSSQDIDRSFIATNFEEVDLEANDDKSLCRYEFLEILCRMAKIKYYDKGYINSIWESTERLIEDYIVPNFREHQAW